MKVNTKKAALIGFAASTVLTLAACNKNEEPLTYGPPVVQEYNTETGTETAQEVSEQAVRRYCKLEFEELLDYTSDKRYDALYEFMTANYEQALVDMFQNEKLVYSMLNVTDGASFKNALLAYRKNYVKEMKDKNANINYEVLEVNYCDHGSAERILRDHSERRKPYDKLMEAFQDCDEFCVISYKLTYDYADGKDNVYEGEHIDLCYLEDGQWYSTYGILMDLAHAISLAK